MTDLFPVVSKSGGGGGGGAHPDSSSLCAPHHTHTLEEIQDQQMPCNQNGGKLDIFNSKMEDMKYYLIIDK